MMIKLNLNIPFVDLDGKQIGKETLGVDLAKTLVGGSKGEALKFYDWAVALHKGQEISVDNADIKKISEFIEQDTNMTVLLKAQLLKAIDECAKKAKDGVK